MLQRLSWDSLQQRRAHNRVWMFYRIRNGLVAIPPDQLKQTTVATRRHETRYTCKSDATPVCIARRSFQAQSDYGTVYLQKPATSHLTASSWSCRRLISSDYAPCFYLTALHDFIFRKFAQHTIPQHMNSTRSAILLYIELALVLEDEEEDEGTTNFSSSDY